MEPYLKYICLDYHEYTITGDNLQFVNVELAPNRRSSTRRRCMAYMTGK